MAASGQPAFGERCLGASTKMFGIAEREGDVSQMSTAVSRAGMRLMRSSKRAAAQPNSSYFSVRLAIILSAVSHIPMQMWFHTTSTSFSNIIATLMLSTVTQSMQSSITSNILTREQIRQMLLWKVHPKRYLPRTSTITRKEMK